MKYTGSTKESTVYSQELMTVTKKKKTYLKKSEFCMTKT